MGIKKTLLNYKLYDQSFYRNGNMLLGIKSVEAETSGVYTWKIYNPTNDSIFEEVNIQVCGYHAPTVSLKPRPCLYNENYSAVCMVVNYFPLRSTKLLWFNDGQIIDKKYVTETYSVWMDGLITRVSTLSIPVSEVGESPPNLRCDVEWHQNSVVYKRFSNTVTPTVHYKPTISIEFDNGKAICTAKCVSRDTISLRWTVGETLKSFNGGGDVMTGPCVEYPGLINIQNKIDIPDFDGSLSYTCFTTGYPKIFPRFYNTKVFDSSPEVVSKSMLISIVAVIGGAIFVIILIFITAMCFYCSKSNKI
nr:envelope glycoprotein C-like protein [Phocid alphaherpesvirus 1]